MGYAKQQPITTAALLTFERPSLVCADEIRFDVRLMQRVPYEGVSRMTTSMKRKHRDRCVAPFRASRAFPDSRRRHRFLLAASCAAVSR